MTAYSIRRVVELDKLQTPADFGQVLTRLRVEAGLTVRQMAKASGIPASTLGGYLSGRHLPHATRPEVMVALLAAVSASDPPADEWMTALHRLTSYRVPNDLQGLRPYQGLGSFTVAESSLLFGRDADIAAALALVMTLADGDDAWSRIGVISGPSGTGKSSLVQAGLLPALGPDWTVTSMRPGADASQSLQDALASLDAGRHLLVVDQGEELWTRTSDEARAGFLTALGELPPRCCALIVMRADFLVPASQETVLLESLQVRQQLVGPMDAEQLAAAITGPADLFGLVLAPGLVDRMVNDALAPTQVRSGGVAEW